MDGQDDAFEEADAVVTERVSVEQLFREHARFVAAFLYRLGVPEADVDDAVQEVFAVALRKGGFTPGAASPRSWLGAIAVRVASTTRRSVSRRREDFEESGTASPQAHAATAQATLETRQSLARVERALASLDVAHRAVFVLYELEGEDCKHIAESLGIAVGTVYSRLHEARRRFMRAHDDLLRAEAQLATRELDEARSAGPGVWR